jgi:hypothetical protein
MDFNYLPATIVDELYEEPAKLEVLTFDDLLNLPMNDLYLKENGNDPKTFAKYTADTNYTIDDANDFLHIYEVIDNVKVYYNIVFPSGLYNRKTFTTKLRELLLEVSPYFDVDESKISNSKYEFVLSKETTILNLLGLEKDQNHGTSGFELNIFYAINKI